MAYVLLMPAQCPQSALRKLIHAQTASLKAHSSRPIEKSPFGSILKILLQGEKRNCHVSFSFLCHFFNGLEVYVTCNQGVMNVMPGILNFSRDQHGICIDIVHVSFAVLSFSKCQWLFRIIGDPGL